MSAPPTRDVGGNRPPSEFPPYTIPIDNNLISTLGLEYTTSLPFASDFHGQNLIVQDWAYESPSSYLGPASSPRNSEGDSYGGPILAASSDKYQCYCGKAFSRPSSLNQHQKGHIKNHKCNIASCDKAFSTQKDLIRHMRTHRKGEGYQCKVDGCRKSLAGHVYSRKDNFDRHMRTAHAEATS